MTIWRAAYIAIILFWLCMTGLLVQRTYFPEDGGLQSVSPNLVLQRFCQHSDFINNLNLMRGKQKLGHATISSRLWLDDKTASPRGFTIQAGGMVEGEAWSQPGMNMSWSFTGRVDQAQVWHALDLRLRSPISSVIFIWEKGQPEPRLEVMNDGKLVMDTQSLKAQAKLGAMIPGMGSFSFLSGDQAQQEIALETAIGLSAKEGQLMLANQRRKAFQLTIQLVKLLHATATFTESGELASVELPNQMQFLDPIIFGLSQDDIHHQHQ